MLEHSLWQKAVGFHGHMCPGLAIGFKACEGAIEELGLDASKLPAIDEELVCVTENDACGVAAPTASLTSFRACGARWRFRSSCAATTAKFACV